MQDAYDELVLSVFLEQQGQLFPEPVAKTEEDAEEFLAECMAVVCSDLDEAREYLDESGMDVTGLSDEELENEAEVFRIPDGRYLIVEG